jgi:hypothetical protein
MGHPLDSETRRFVKCLRRDPDTGAMVSTGTRELIRKHGCWYRITATCGLVRAKRSDFEGKVPADFEDDPDFGQPGFPRHPVGYIPPDQRPVRMRETHDGPYGPVEGTHPVPASEVAARLALGWQLL